MNDPETDATEEESQGIRCDFCGDESPSVRRIALDGDYDRLRKVHQTRYACPTCSERKERQRLGFLREPSRG